MLANMGVDPDRKGIALTAKVHNDDADDDDDGEVTPILKFRFATLPPVLRPPRMSSSSSLPPRREPQETTRRSSR